MTNAIGLAFAKPEERAVFFTPPLKPEKREPRQEADEWKRLAASLSGLR
jgi:hypothetical protein